VNVLAVVIVVPAYMYKELNIIQSVGVEVRGPKMSPAVRRKCLATPVLEKYVFIPSVEPAHLDLHSALRVCMQIAVENKHVIHMKVVEVHNQGITPLSCAVALVLADIPLVKASFAMCMMEGA
jgi:hypothetical protein